MVGLILYVLIGGDREPGRENTAVQTGNVTEETGTIIRDEMVSGSDPLAEEVGSINRSLLIPPGMRAREYVAQLKEQGKPYPLGEAREKAVAYQQDGSLADAYLLFFFAAREGHAPSMLEMARLNDPRYFKPDNALLDEADPVQALKWYRQARDSGDTQASNELTSLRSWAETGAAAGDEAAAQFLLNFR